ncbi:MAG: ComEC/Rec2 family competence protein [Nodosilinea sp.]
MGATAALLWCGAYSVGLIWVSLLVHHGGLSPWAGAGLAGIVALAVGGLAALFAPSRWRLGLQPWVWGVAGVIGLLAALNYAWRYPTPGPMDISRLLDQGEAASAQQEVGGWVQEMPRLTRSEKGQFWLKTDQVRRLNDADLPLGPPQAVRGNLYVTVPADKIKDVFPGQRVRVRGKLYAPAAPKNPNAFNFQQYLAANDCYAGFSGKWVDRDIKAPPAWWRLWRLRVRIAKAHQVGLGSPAGPLVSAMALGHKAVNVPYDIQDAFIQAGLAHTLAASGFHVSLVLGVVLGLMGNPALAKRFANPALAKVMAGALALSGYVLLTGGQPSVMRASLMGAGALVGLALERRVKPLGCLLVAVILLLLWNPTWVDNIGFRLSVIATLGLVVGVKPLTERLTWLPTSLATVAAVPLAAYFWTIPLSLYYFNTLTTYSIVLNMLVTPLVTVISLGGILSGLVAMLSPGLASVLAWVLWLPTQILIGLVKWEISLPGSSLATGHISLLQMFGLYGLYLLGWQHHWFAQRRWLVGLLLVLLAMGPIWYRAATLAEVTVLAADDNAVMVVQDRRETLLVNGGTERTAFYTVVPFLRQAGINRLASAVSGPDSDGENWRTIADKTPIHRFYSAEAPVAEAHNIRTHHPLSPGPGHGLGRQRVEYWDDEAPTLRLTLFGTRSWLLLPELSPEQQRSWAKAHPILPSEVLWWHGEALDEAVLAAVQPRVVIASATRLDAATEQRLRGQGVQVFWTDRDGAITWHPKRGYQGYLSTRHRPIAALE